MNKQKELMREYYNYLEDNNITKGEGAELLGTSSMQLAEWRYGNRKLPKYMRKSIETRLELFKVKRELAILKNEVVEREME